MLMLSFSNTNTHNTYTIASLQELCEDELYHKINGLI